MGVVRRLRRAFGDESGSYVGYSAALRPPPGMGQWYVSVGQNTCVTTCKDAGEVGTHTVTVCATCKYAYAPTDRKGELELNTYGFPDLMPGFGSNGLPPLFERPEVQPPIHWLTHLAGDHLLGDYELLKDVNYYLGFDKSGESHGTAGWNDSQWGAPVPFTQSSSGVIQPQDGTWVEAGGGSRDGIEIKMLTLSGLITIMPARYWRGSDRELETS